MSVGDLIGIPYVLRGESLEGCDCVGLVKLFNTMILGRQYPSFNELYSDYRASPELGSAVDSQRSKFELCTDPQPGDTVLFRVGAHVCHIGVFLNGSEFIHASAGKLSGVERFDSPSWSKRLAGVYRLRSI
jgi:cell wall-associated NlpC family hydrolase